LITHPGKASLSFVDSHADSHGQYSVRLYLHCLSLSSFKLRAQGEPTNKYRCSSVKTGAPSMKNVQLHTIDETAQLLSVSRSSVYRLIKANELLVVHIGCSARIPNKCLVDYVERLTRQERLVAQ